MHREPAHRQPWWPLLLVAAGAWLLRIAGFFHRGGALGHPVDYDEGVYFSAAALLYQGLLPYRDYFFVHPPGIAVLLSPVAALSHGLGPALAFSVVRWLMPLAGALSTLLSGRIAQQRWGTRAGLVAALAYAVYPEAVSTERGPFLEPLLNLTCLTLAWVWLRPSTTQRQTQRRDLLAGALLATACAIKLTAGAWVLAVAWARGMSREGSRVARVILVAAGVGLVWLGPFFLLAPDAMLQGLLRFQLLRPPDGDSSLTSRLLSILVDGRLGLTLVTVIGVTVALARARQQDAVTERLFSAAWLLTVATFLASKSYWSQYNAHLAPTTAVLTGLGADFIVRQLHGARTQRIALAVTALLILTTLPGVLRAAKQKDRFLLPLGDTLRSTVPTDAVLCAFEPAWAIAADRLPGLPLGNPAFVDPYGLMLNDALLAPTRFPNAEAAFQDAHSQRTALQLLPRCDVLLLLGRGEWQLSDTSEQWVREHFTRDAELWRRNP
ncbi:glycosyltransferase family 39 protein [Myxococcus sp. AS-1-15]|uniref:glycosyltransferase family 39 protein n=1 Tax=Myxococcus sp. AS-1-15 TaxID=2874600 RepID=UPI001CBBF990|nr:glycosyltransferase family 39 protein [Myxococcus sp. AS-1-15]